MVSLFGLLLVRPENKESKGFFRESYHCLINSLNEREDFMMNEAIVEKVKALVN